jgi:predicted TIM-barrel fold metal-dependent hydrolase
VNTLIRIPMLGLLLGLGVSGLHAEDRYFVDAHSQFDQDVVGSFILQRMDAGGVYKTILAARRQRKPGDAVKLTKKYPQRIVASVRTKGGPYANNSPKYYKQLRKQVESGKFGAMAELLVFHAQKGDKAEEVRIALDDERVQAALKYAKQQGWPFVVHIEFASLKGAERDDYMQQLNKFLAANAPHPIAMIHMGQLPLTDVAALIKAHGNIYFLTSHADPVSAKDATQPWINMMDGDKFKPGWRQLITQHPERFIFAMDNVWAFQWEDTYMQHIKVWRSALAELPAEVANAVAHGNAEKLWQLTPK